MRHPTGFGPHDIIAGGNTSMVYFDQPSQTVIKFPHDNKNHAQILMERRIYERLQQHGGHKGLLRYYGPYESGIRLEYAPNFAFISWLRKHKETSLDQRIRWAGQITSALCYIHSMNVIHGDVTSHNVFLTKELNAKLGDFAEPSPDGSRLRVHIRKTHQYPGPALSIRGDLFALGSTIYEIMAGRDPYGDRLDGEVELLYRQGLFPMTDHLGPIGRSLHDARERNTTVPIMYTQTFKVWISC